MHYSLKSKSKSEELMSKLKHKNFKRAAEKSSKSVDKSEVKGIKKALDKAMQD